MTGGTSHDRGLVGSEEGWSDHPDERRTLAGTAVLQKAFDLLDLIGETPGQIDSSELLRRTGIPKATLYRLLSALQLRGLIRTEPASQNYSLGFHLIELAQKVWSSSDLVSVAANELRRLRDMTGETSYLAVLHNGAVRSLGRFDGAHSRRSSAALGVTKPLHCTSQGKAILSNLGTHQVIAMLPETLTRYTANTITDLPQFLAQLEIIRARGFAIDDEEILEGTRCAGAAILNSAGYPVGAISVAGPSFRITQRRAEQLGHELAAATQRIAVELNRTSVAAGGGPSSATAASPIQAFFGASVLWDEAHGCVVWVDRLGPAIHWTGECSTSVALDSLDMRIDGAFLHQDGAAVLTRGRMIVIGRDGHSTRFDLGPDFQACAVRVDHGGRVWVAQFNRDRDVSKIGLLTENSLDDALWEVGGEVTDLAISRDGLSIYAAVPGRNLIFLISPKDGRKRLFSRLPEATGRPMGMALDAEERLWVVVYEGWSVVRLDADGEFDHVVPLPVPTPTSLAFGGPDLKTLYVASARSGLSSETLNNAPLSGRLLSLKTPTAGVAEPVAKLSLPAMPVAQPVDSGALIVDVQP